MQIVRLIRAIAAYRRKYRKRIAVDRELNQRITNGERHECNNAIQQW